MGTTPVVIDITLGTYRRTVAPFVLKYAVFSIRFLASNKFCANTADLLSRYETIDLWPRYSFKPLEKLQKYDNAVSTSAVPLLGPRI